MYAGCPEVLGYATDALILAQDWPAAQAQLDGAMEFAQRIGDRLYVRACAAEGAHCPRSQRRPRSARGIARALREARTQEALGMELEALVALAELDGCEPDDLAALAGVYQEMREGFDTEIYLRANALLDRRARDLIPTQPGPFSNDSDAAAA